MPKVGEVEAVVKIKWAALANFPLPASGRGRGSPGPSLQVLVFPFLLLKFKDNGGFDFDLICGCPHRPRPYTGTPSSPPSPHPNITNSKMFGSVVRPVWLHPYGAIFRSTFGPDNSLFWTAVSQNCLALPFLRKRKIPGTRGNKKRETATNGMFKPFGVSLLLWFWKVLIH